MREAIQFKAEGTGAACIRPAPRIFRSKRIILGVSTELGNGKHDWIDRVDHNQRRNKSKRPELCIGDADQRWIALHQHWADFNKIGQFKGMAIDQSPGERTSDSNEFPLARVTQQHMGRSRGIFAKYAQIVLMSPS